MNNFYFTEIMKEMAIKKDKYTKLTGFEAKLNKAG